MEILKASQCRGGYKPTAEDLERIKNVPDSFLLSGDGIFTTLQGEGPRLGLMTTFVRLQKCNLRCGFCDSWYTWKTDEENFYREPEWVKRIELTDKIYEEQRNRGIENYVNRVVFTGGEPMLQQREMLNWIKENPIFEVEIETNATIMPGQPLLDNPLVAFNASPKLESSNNSMRQRFKRRVLDVLSSKESTAFKFVCSTEQDIYNVLDEYGFLPRRQIWIMPEGVTKEENYESYVNIRAALFRYGLQTTPRLQNIMFDGSLRGV